MASNIKVDIVRPTATNGSLSLKGDSGGSATTNGVTVNSSGNTSITGTTTVSSLVATTADINGGTIDGVTIGGSSAETGTFTTATATTVDSTNLEVTNIKAKDGTSAGSIADSTGVVTLASSVLTTVDINGGAIDGTTIGGATPAAGSFTQVNAGDGAEANPSITNTGDTNTGLYFPAADTVGVSTNGSERMRIGSSGNVLVGTKSNVSLEKVNITYSGNNNWALLLNDTFSNVNANSAIRFIKNGNYVGSVATTNTSTSFNTSSDYRLKTDVQPMTGATERLKALNPVNFAWKVDGSRVDGFIAHETQEVVPEAVTGTKDDVDAEGNPEYQSIDQAKLVPLLTAALQEAVSKIESLEQRIATLETAAA